MMWFPPGRGLHGIPISPRGLLVAPLPQPVLDGLGRLPCVAEPPAATPERPRAVSKRVMFSTVLSFIPPIFVSVPRPSGRPAHTVRRPARYGV